MSREYFFGGNVCKTTTRLYSDGTISLLVFTHENDEPEIEIFMKTKHACDLGNSLISTAQQQIVRELKTKIEVL